VNAHRRRERTQSSDKLPVSKNLAARVTGAILDMTFPATVSTDL
jgi:hypothetical protein